MFNYIEGIFSNILIYFEDKNISPSIFYNELVESSLDFTKIALNNVIAKPDSKLTCFGGIVLSKLMGEGLKNIYKSISDFF